ncbi:MAG: hypothetical protein ACC644_01680 [Candidatus Hydrothermarchaeales archaeon]
MNVYVTSVDLTSYLQAANNEKGQLKEIQVKLGDNNKAELGAYLDLKDRGVNFAGPIYAKGRIVKGSPTTLRLEIESVKAGWVPVPGNYVDQGENALEDTRDISGGLLHFQSDFPKSASTP